MLWCLCLNVQNLTSNGVRIQTHIQLAPTFLSPFSSIQSCFMPRHIEFAHSLDFVSFQILTMEIVWILVENRFLFDLEPNH